MTYRLSSTFTLFYKYVVSSATIFFSLVLTFLCCFVFPSDHWDLYIVIIPFFLLVSTAMLPLFKLEVVDYSETHVIIIKNNGVVRIPFQNIQRLRHSLFFFFKIIYLDDQQTSNSIMILPKVREIMLTLGSRSESYDRLKEFRIKSNKQQSSHPRHKR